MNTRVVLNKSQYNNPQPEILIAFPANVHYREKKAEIYKLAARIELASKDETWIVVPEVYGDKIRLELISQSNEEIDRGLRVLEDVLGLEHS